MEVLYIHTEEVHNFKAAEEVLPFIIETFKPNSVLDVGCGIGTWLKVAKELGIKNVTGVDGDYVDRALLKIDKSEFVPRDLRSPFSLNDKFDIALCLEVVEHLPEYASTDIVSTLCHHSDIIIFSAAIPNQGGQHHINEQWPTYWIEKFLKNGYQPFDILRPVFWDNNNVEYWYRQNMIVFSKKNIYELFTIKNNGKQFSYVHPALFEKKVEEIRCLEKKIEYANVNPGIKNSLKALMTAFRKKYFNF